MLPHRHKWKYESFFIKLKLNRLQNKEFGGKGITQKQCDHCCPVLNPKSPECKVGGGVAKYRTLNATFSPSTLPTNQQAPSLSDQGG